MEIFFHYDNSLILGKVSYMFTKMVETSESPFINIKEHIVPSLHYSISAESAFTVITAQCYILLCTIYNKPYRLRNMHMLCN